MNRLVAFFDRVLGTCLMLLMLSIVLTVTWQVLARYVLQAPSSGSEELARFLLIWIGLLGSVYCYRTQMHLGLNIVTKKMTTNNQKYAELFSQVIVLIFASAVLVLGGAKLVHLTFNPIQTSAALGIEVGFIYCILPLSGLLFCFYASIEIFTLIFKTSNNKEFSNGN